MRCKRRFKDGKEHRYWSVVENVRVRGRRVVQRHVIYLGEINDSQRAAWCRSIEVVEGKSGSRQMALFPNDRDPPALDCEVVKINLAEVSLHDPRQWGACWLALSLWDRLDLDRFWGERLPPSRQGTRWLDILKILACYRLIDPGSEWRLHRHWYEHSALRDLLGSDRRAIADDTLYRCLDKLLEHKQDFFSFLRARWATLFETRFDVLLYDLTSTYFESDPPFDDKRRFGYPLDGAKDIIAAHIPAMANKLVIRLFISSSSLSVCRKHQPDASAAREPRNPRNCQTLPARCRITAKKPRQARALNGPTRPGSCGLRVQERVGGALARNGRRSVWDRAPSCRSMNIVVRRKIGILNSATFAGTILPTGWSEKHIGQCGHDRSSCSGTSEPMRSGTNSIPWDEHIGTRVSIVDPTAGAAARAGLKNRGTANCMSSEAIATHAAARRPQPLRFRSPNTPCLYVFSALDTRLVFGLCGLGRRLKVVRIACYSAQAFNADRRANPFILLDAYGPNVDV